MKKSRTKHGFTFIELMVVISIISILSSVVLVSLNGARTQGKNARLQQDVSQLRNRIEETWNGTYYPLLVSVPAGSSGTSVAEVVTPPWIPPTVSPEMTIITNDILSQNGGSYGGNSFTGGSGCLTYCVNNGYSGGSCANGTSTNGLTVFVDSNSLMCSYLIYGVKYAIYAAYGPNLGSSGYFCSDSSGGAIDRKTGGIPSVPGPGTTCN